MIAVYLLISAMPLIRHPLWSGLAADLTAIKYLGIIALAYAVLHLHFRRTPVRFLSTWQARWFVAFAILGMSSYLFKGIPQVTWERSPFMNHVSFLLFFVITLIVVDSVHRLRWVLLWAVGGVAFASMHLIREWQAYGGMGMHRPGWVTGDPNYFMISALACLPIAFYLAQRSSHHWERLFCSGCVIVTCVATVLAASRGGFLGLLAACLFGVLRSRQRVRTLVLLSLFLLATLIFPNSPLRRFLQPARYDVASGETRTALWAVGLHMIADHPLTGIGLGNFKPFLEFYAGDELRNVAHNSFLEITAEMGVPAALIFLAMLVAAFTSLERVRRLTRKSHNSLVHLAACGIQAGLIGDAVALFFVSGQSQKLFWLLLFLSMCLPSLARLEQADKAARARVATENAIAATSR
jgi:O-antigen ligase